MLLLALPAEQKPAFEALLVQTAADRDQIRVELDQLYQILVEMKKGTDPKD